MYFEFFLVYFSNYNEKLYCQQLSVDVIGAKTVLSNGCDRVFGWFFCRPGTPGTGRLRILAF